MKWALSGRPLTRKRIASPSGSLAVIARTSRLPARTRCGSARPNTGGLFTCKAIVALPAPSGSVAVNVMSNVRPASLWTAV